MNDPISQLFLTPEERRSSLWRKLMERWEFRLSILRKENEGDKSEIETAKLRGRIAELKAYISLDKDRPDVEAPPR